MAPELEWWILDELNESDEQSPGVRTVHYQPLEQNSRDLLLDGLGVGLGKEVKECAAEVVGVTVGVAQLIGDCVKEQVTACREGKESVRNQWCQVNQKSNKI